MSFQKFNDGDYVVWRGTSAAEPLYGKVVCVHADGMLRISALDDRNDSNAWAYDPDYTTKLTPEETTLAILKYG